MTECIDNEQMTLNGISDLGFLPHVCINKLPKRFEFFQSVLNNLAENLKMNDKFDGSFRKYVNDLPTYNILEHNAYDLSEGDMQYMYSILCMIMNRYIWCGGVNDAKNYNIIPAIISVPLYQVAKKLGISVSLTHAAVDLWNWHLIDEKQPFSLKNIAINHTMTGSESESWFYLIMIAIEGVGGKHIRELMTVYNYIDEPQQIIEFLQKLENDIKQSNEIIAQLYQHCDPDFFFNRLRIYLSGSMNPHLPDGVVLDLSKIGLGMKTIRYMGGSAAQSTLIQVYDTFLEITHTKEGVMPCTFLNKMREYMPAKHRQYIQMLAKFPSIRNYIFASGDKQLVSAYNNCIDQLVAFRQIHKRIVTTYIYKFIKTNENTDNNAHGAKGTGGTNPLMFCSAVIDGTIAAKIPNETFAKKVSRYCNNIQKYPVILLGFTALICYAIYPIWCPDNASTCIVSDYNPIMPY